VSRADFKDILAAGEWVSVQRDEMLPMWAEGKEGKAAGTTMDAFGDTYYYVFGGKIDCSVKYGGDFKHSWNSTAGGFVNNFPLLTLFGGAPGALAIQDGEVNATVASDSVVFAVATEDLSVAPRFGALSGHGFKTVPKVQKAGALLFRWRRDNIISRIVRSGGFAADAFHLMLSQSIMEQLYETVLTKTSPELGNLYHDLRRTRMDHDLAPLPRNIKERKQKKPFTTQWRHSHGWPWNVSPKERAVNSLTCGSNELQRLDAMRDNAPYLQTLSRIFDRELSESSAIPGKVSSRPSLARQPIESVSVEVLDVAGSKGGSEPKTQ
jgi:hypothetical protein